MDDNGRRSLADSRLRRSLSQPEGGTPDGPRVLLVDDSPVSRYLTCVLLACWGIKPRLAFDGAEAVELASAFPLDLILMDLQMPVMDGVEATACIRRFEREHSRARVPVVAYTSNAVPGGEDFLRESGMDGVLPKPCPPATLRDCLVRWCEPRDGLAGHAEAPPGVDH